MRGKRISVGPFIVILISAASLCAADRVIPDTPRGFDGQYGELFKACKKGDEPKIQELLTEFAIPSSWFTDIFGPAKGEELQKQYSTQHKQFVSSTLKKLRGFNKSDASVYTKSGSAGELKPPAAAPPQSLKPIPTAHDYEIHYSTEGTERSTWMDNFIYVDGKFRFFGPGGYPFWDPPNIRLANACGGPPNGQLIHRVEPEYPDEARQKHIEGFVRMRVTVATDGSVKAIDILDGDSLLVEASKKAVMQWRYTPFMNCGAPVEMRSMEHVKFPPPPARPLN
jgi:TonB family protein